MHRTDPCSHEQPDLFRRWFQSNQCNNWTACHSEACYFFSVTNSGSPRALYKWTLQNCWMFQNWKFLPGSMFLVRSPHKLGRDKEISERIFSCIAAPPGTIPHQYCGDSFIGIAHLHAMEINSANPHNRTITEDQTFPQLIVWEGTGGWSVLTLFLSAQEQDKGWGTANKFKSNYVSQFVLASELFRPQCRDNVKSTKHTFIKYMPISVWFRIKTTLPANTQE